MTETRTVSSVTANSRAAGSTMPVRSTGSNKVVHPRLASALNVLRTASCSMADAMRCRRLVGDSCASTTPRMAKLSASVPPLVKTTSWGRAPRRVATADRASSTHDLAACPNVWTLEAFPNWSRRTPVTASTTRWIDWRRGIVIEVDAHCGADLTITPERAWLLRNVDEGTTMRRGGVHGAALPFHGRGEHPGVIAGGVTASKIKKDRDHRVGQPPLRFDLTSRRPQLIGKDPAAVKPIRRRYHAAGNARFRVWVREKQDI